MQIIIEDVVNTSRRTYSALYAANFGYWGMMRDMLMECRRGEWPGKAVQIWSGNSRRGSLYGWSLVFPCLSGGHYAAATDWNRRVATHSAMFWVVNEYRRKGYGSLLMDEVQKIDPRPHVYPHDVKSGALFENRKITVSSYDLNWLSEGRKGKPSVA